MKRQSLKSQALFITCSGALVRAVGFGMRLWVSRLLGAEAVGIMELASGAHMLALTPAAAGLPTAVSRLTARANTDKDRQRILYAGRQLARRMALCIMPLFLFLSPWIARALGDERTLPSLLFFVPCVLFIGLSGVYDGYFLGKSNALPPTLSELGEQLFRLLTLALLSLLIPRVTAAWRAAAPALAGLVGESMGLAIVWLFCGKTASFRHDPALRLIRKELWGLSFPMILNRLCHTGLRTLSNLIIPTLLMAAGLSRSEAMSRLGMLNGMVMPLMFLPGLLAGSLAMVGGPAAAKCVSPAALRRLVLRLTLPALAAGGACTGGLYVLAPWIAHLLYRLPELTLLIRALCPMALLLPTQQVVTGLMNGLGMQNHTLLDGMLGAAFTLLFTFLWVKPLGIVGAGYASMLGHFVCLLCSGVHLAERMGIIAKGEAH